MMRMTSRVAKEACRSRVAGWILGLGLMLVAGTGCGSGAGSAGMCHDNRPPPGTPFLEGGSSCTLPNGRPGVGQGEYGCIDPTLCHCTLEAGPATCATGAVCVYAACSGANQGAACARPGGQQGTCCNGTCSAIDLRTNPFNCGGCGNVCPQGVSCDYGACAIPFGTIPTCPHGLVGAAATCVGTSCSACVAASCSGLADGAPCSVQSDAGQGEQLAGLCCQGACAAWYADNQNCGGCGVTCCPGTKCERTELFTIAAVCI
jgi:hypothetical protein